MRFTLLSLEFRTMVVADFGKQVFILIKYQKSKSFYKMMDSANKTSEASVI